MDKETKIIRMVTGEDIVASMKSTETEGCALLINPMRIVFRRMPNGKSVLFMTPWLPAELLESNQTEVYSEDIITIMTPKAEFIEYYENLLIEENSYSNEKDIMLREELTKMTESLHEETEEFESMHIDKKFLH
jgi:hypothetical protein